MRPPPSGAALRLLEDEITMTNAAVVEDTTNVVVNVIVANENGDQPPNDCYLVNIPDGYPCSIGWFWDGTSFIQPNAD